MINITETVVSGWDAAIRGMRNPLESWDRSDSRWVAITNHPTSPHDFRFSLGDADLKLLKSLAKAGPDHGKVLRYIEVTFDLEAPIYFWKEFDTYRVGVVDHPTDIEMNSCSTMHKIHAKEFTMDDFSIENLREMSYRYMKATLKLLNLYRLKFLSEKDKSDWWQLIQLLPSSYNQKRTIKLNYAVLRTMYHARKNHKLDEWRNVCEWIKTLPYSEVITDEERVAA